MAIVSEIVAKNDFSVFKCIKSALARGHIGRLFILPTLDQFPRDENGCSPPLVKFPSPLRPDTDQYILI